MANPVVSTEGRRPEWRDLTSTISRLSSKQGLSTPRFALRSRRRVFAMLALHGDAYFARRRPTIQVAHEQSERHAGPDVPALFFPTPAPSLCRLGQSRRAAAAAGAWRARPLPQLGLGGAGAAQGLAHHLPRPARPRRQPMVARRQLLDGRLHLRSRPARAPAGPGAGDDRRPFAGRQHLPALCRRLSRTRCASWSPSRGWARRPR